MTKESTLTPFERLLTADETATTLGVSLSWLAKARLRGDGPLFIKIGRTVRYSASAIRDYLRARTRNSTSEQ
jgi:predicted DNA-binding transcriptional regulator AlpA